MEIFLLKSWMSVLLFLTAALSLLTMLFLQGKPESRFRPGTLRRIHRISGFIFALLLITISYFCLKHWRIAGDGISPRGVCHAVFAMILWAVFIIKISIARFFKNLLKYVPALGLIVFTLVFVVTFTSAGFYFLRTTCLGVPAVTGMKEAAPLSSVSAGKKIFLENCSICHYSDLSDKKVGPGLKGVTSKEKLESGLPATKDGLRSQIRNPYLTMPAFPHFSESEMEQLLEYLTSL